MITKNSVMKIQNNFMNHKSQPIKLNPEYGCELYKKLPEDGKEIFVEYRKKKKKHFIIIVRKYYFKK